MQQQREVLRDLQVLRNLKLARSRVVGLLGGGGGEWLRHQEEQDELRQSLLRNEAVSRAREMRFPPRTVSTTVSFRLSEDGTAVAPLPRRLAKVRGLRVVGGTVPHPLAHTFREGKDDCVPFAYTQRWDVLRVKLTLVGGTDATTKQDGDRVLSFTTRLDVGPSRETVQACFAKASASAAGSALRDVLAASVVGIADDTARTILVGAPGEPPPSDVLYSLVVSEKFSAYWVVAADPPDGFVAFQANRAAARAAARPHYWKADTAAGLLVDVVDEALGARADRLLQWTGSYPEGHRASAAVAHFAAALAAPMVLSRPSAGTGTSSRLLQLERTASVTLQFRGATLTCEAAVLVLQGAATHYAQILELGAASETTDVYLHAGQYGEHVSLVLDPPSSAAVISVAFEFATGRDTDRQAAPVFGFARGKDVAIARGHTLVAPYAFMHHRAGQLILVSCDEVRSHVGGGPGDKPGWFEYGTHHEHAQQAPAPSTNLPTGVYGSTTFNPELRSLDSLSLRFSMREVDDTGSAGEVPFTCAPGGAGFSLMLEADVAAL